MYLSIIMPVYNAGNYLNETLNSIVGQNADFSEIEFIIINDGSTDDSEKILNYYADKYNFISLQTKENGGEASSRNLGLSLAKGEYITFIDADDLIYPGSLGSIINRLKDLQIDIAYLSIDLIDKDSNFIGKYNLPVGEDCKILNGLEHKRRPFPPTIYKRKLIGQINYPSDIMIGPDAVFNFMVQYFAERVTYIDIPYYQYRQISTSLSKQGKSEKAFDGFMNALLVINEFEQTVEISTVKHKQYIDNAYIIFMQRILELSILPNFQKNRYYKFKTLLSKINKEKLCKVLDAKYPYFSKSFMLFANYQRYLLLKSWFYKLFV